VKLNRQHRRSLVLCAVAIAACSVAACGKSAPVSSPADITVCKKWATLESNQGNNPLATFESEWESDAPPASSQLQNDVNTYLNLMEAGGFEPGSGEQTQTAQTGVNVSNDCQAIGISSDG
jgi:hypothetical protein